MSFNNCFGHIDEFAAKHCLSSCKSDFLSECNKKTIENNKLKREIIEKVLSVKLEALRENKKIETDESFGPIIQVGQQKIQYLLKYLGLKNTINATMCFKLIPNYKLIPFQHVQSYPEWYVYISSDMKKASIAYNNTPY